MKKRETVFNVSTTRTFKSEGSSPGNKTWDLVEKTSVLAVDAADAIARVREYFNRQDKGDGTIMRRTAFIFGSVIEGETLTII